MVNYRPRSPPLEGRAGWSPPFVARRVSGGRVLLAPWRLNQVAGPTGCPVRPLDAVSTIASWRNARKRPLVRGILIAMETVPTLESVRRDALRLSQDARELLALDLAESMQKDPEVISSLSRETVIVTSLSVTHIFECCTTSEVSVIMPCTTKQEF